MKLLLSINSTKLVHVSKFTSKQQYNPTLESYLFILLI